MVRLGSVLLATIALAGTAAAADLPAKMYTKAPVAIAAPYNWTGFYLGLNAGGSWGHQSSVLTSVATGAAVLANQPSSLKGFIGGGQIGYNWQSSQWVWGIEADFQGSGQKSSRQFNSPGALICGIACFLVAGDNVPYSDKLDWFGTVRGRVGWAFDRWLPYVTGGFAYGHGTINGAGTIGAAPVAFNSSKTYDGWTLGGGVEWAFDKHWSAKAEYLYIDFGNGPTIPLTAALSITTGHMTDNIGRAGVNYKF
jgi:outer membrane immunogenic protein